MIRRTGIQPLLVCATALLLCSPALAAAPKLDQTPAKPGEWGYRPVDGSTSAVTPPGFSWRPQKEIASWDLQIAGPNIDQPIYAAEDIPWSVHCPSKALPVGDYAWRYRGRTSDGEATDWSAWRRFHIAEGARKLPMPPRDELLARIPEAHPRLFLRPEDLPRLRELAKGELKPQYDALVARCEKWLKNPPKTDEPPRYPEGMVRGGEEWRAIWWGNRTYTINALHSAATLGFTRRIGGKEEYGQLAKRILLDCAKWDPKGATGYRYNDEAGMPYAYHFSRTYTFVHDLLTDEEREICRNVMRVRGEEMYKHLCPRHLWTPYASHSNRAWHFLGEVGIAFHGEIEEADDWSYFAMNVFYNTYPVWCDDDGGWHEGASYWNSYISRFTWWADIMRSAFDVNAYDKPYFAEVGNYPLYLAPPGKLGVGFGDLTADKTAKGSVPLVSILAAQAENPYWTWYVESMGGPVTSDDYNGFLRGALPKVEAKSPDELPASRCFQGTGQVYMNTTLLDADRDVQVVFKSSPFGTQSHGYESNNAFLLWAYGERLLIRTGRRDMYGSDHHKNWMWTTRSINGITVDGIGQRGHDSSAQGRIAFFETTPTLDVVMGECAKAYDTKKSEKRPDGRVLDRCTRTIIFAKPELVVVLDELDATAPSTYQYWLHSVNEFDVRSQDDIRLKVGEVECPLQILLPRGLTFEQTNQYDPNPRERIKLREWHLTASTPDEAKRQTFLMVARPQRAADAKPLRATVEDKDGYRVLFAEMEDGGLLRAAFPTDDRRDADSSTLVERLNAAGEVVERITVADTEKP